MKKMDILATLSSDSPGGALGNKSSSVGISGVVSESSFMAEVLVVASVLAVLQSQVLADVVIAVGGSVEGGAVGGLLHSLDLLAGTTTEATLGMTDA